MKILRVKKTNFYDVFLNSGWKNHTRVHVKDGKVGHIAGNKLHKIQFVEIIKTIEGMSK